MMWDFLLKHADSIIAGVTFVGGWIWKARRGEKHDNVRSMLESLAKRVVHEEIGDPSDADAKVKVKAAVQRVVRPVLSKAGIKGSLAERLVHEAEEIALTELARWLSQDAALSDKVSEMAARAADVVKAFTPPDKPLGLAPPFESSDR